MTTRRVLFSYPVCGHRTATLLSIDDAGRFVCQLGAWVFAYEGKARELDPNEKVEDKITPEPVVFKSRLLQEVENAWGDKHLDVKFGILDKKKQPCKCGCGGETLSLFVPGHDMRVKGMIVKMKKGELKFDSLPEITRQLLTTEPKWVDRMKEAGL